MLRMLDWRMSLRRTKSAIISCAGSIIKCAQRCLRSAVWSDTSQSTGRNYGFLSVIRVPSEDWSDCENAQADLRLYWADVAFFFFFFFLAFRCSGPFSQNTERKSNFYLSRLMTKPTKWHVRPAKTQIILGIRPVRSESSLYAWRKLGSLATHWAHSEDSDQTGWMPRLIWVFAGRTGYFVGFVMRRLLLYWAV